MKFVLASWGSRGEVEPCAAVGRELVYRGHDVTMAVPPDLVSFGASAVPNTVGFGSDLQDMMDSYRDFWTGIFSEPWKLRQLNDLMREMWAPIRDSYDAMNTTLKELSAGADLLFASNIGFEVQAANIAEYHNIPLAILHWFPRRPNGQLVPFLPASIGRRAMQIHDWFARGGYARDAEKAQRRSLGLPEASGPWPQRVINHGALEIQAYDEVCFPGLAAEWAAQWGDRRPFVGALTMELTTAADDEILSWMAAGTPPIFFGFGSMPIESPADTLAMIAGACAQVGERALVSTAGIDFSDVPQYEHVKVVGVVNFPAVFPACRAVVHHGGAGTTALSLRAGMPTLILSTDANQALWGSQVKRLKVGTGRHFSKTTQKTLTADLGTILDPKYLEAVRTLSAKMAKPADSVALAADLVERYAHSSRVEAFRAPDVPR